MGGGGQPVAKQSIYAQPFLLVMCFAKFRNRAEVRKQSKKSINHITAISQRTLVRARTRYCRKKLAKTKEANKQE